MNRLFRRGAALLAVSALALVSAPAFAQNQLPSVRGANGPLDTGPVGIVNGNNGSPCIVGMPNCPGVPQGAPVYGASGLAAVSSTISAAGASSSFTPQAGRTFHVQLSGTASASCVLERQLDGATWAPITVTAGGSTTTMYNWTYTGSALSEDVSEDQTSVSYRVDCGAQAGSFSSGSLAVRFSQ